MAKFIDNQKVRFYNGVKYVFKYAGDDEWVCISHDMIPGEIRSEIERDW